MEKKYYQWLTINKLIAIKPLEKNGVQSTISGGIARMNHTFQMAESELLFDAEVAGELLPAGTKVVFRGDAVVHPWNKSPITHGGVTFVLAPFDEVVMHSIPKEELQVSVADTSNPQTGSK